MCVSAWRVQTRFTATACERRRERDGYGHARRDPPPTLQVIGAGFGRTRTLSMREALVRLGFGPCDHIVEDFEHQERFALWDEALHRKSAGESIDWRPLLDRFQSIVDWPGAYFWRELTAAHPDAKVVLPSAMRRDGTTVSAPRSLPSGTTNGPRGPGTSSTPARSTVGSPIGPIAKPSLPGTCRQCARRLPQSGSWSLTSRRGGTRSAPFLGVPVPKGEPFPYVNDTAEFH